MRFFFPDSQDLIDPSFDFTKETRNESRSRQRDDLYAHEVFADVPFDGILVSKGIVDGTGENGSRYSLAQRHRLYRVGVREFFRIGDRPLETMGDCGAFSYVREDIPPYSAEEVLDFYDSCGFDYGLSVDHVILGYKREADNALPGLDLVDPAWRRRQEITLELAAEFMRLHQKRKCRFVPVGIAQGWSPRSYAHAVRELQKIGFSRIALGGMVPLKTPEVLEVLNGVAVVRRVRTQLHLLGVTRFEHVLLFRRYGVTSFDSTSPLRQAFKDDKDNYYTLTTTYPAIRVPQVDANPSLKRRISAGEIDQAKARRLEVECCRALIEFDRGNRSQEQTLALLLEYEKLHDGKRERRREYERVLSDMPWRQCPCEICRQLGIHVIVFRGAERNRRRGFHNVYVFHQRLQHHLSAGATSGRPGRATGDTVRK